MSQNPNALSGAAWVAFGRLTSKAIAFAQMISIGALLGPKDYSVFGVSLVVLTSIELLTEQGLGVALIQRKGKIERYYTTVWSVNVLRGIILTAVLYFGSDSLASMLNSPKSSPLIQTIALLPAIRGFESLAKITYTRDLKFRPLVTVEILAAILSLSVALFSYLLGSNVWALIHGQIASALVSLAGSYVLLSRWPQSAITWRKFRQLNRFGFWVMLSRYSSLALTKGGDIAISAFLTPVSLSYYQYADQLSSASTIEISKIANRVALPFYSRQNGDSTRLKEGFQNSTLLVSTLVCWAGLLISLSSVPIVVGLLGEDWLPTAGLIPLLSIWGYSRAMGACLTSFLMATGQPRSATTFQILMAFSFLSLVIPCATYFGATGVASLLATIGISVSIFRYPLIGKTLGLERHFELLKYSITPFGCAAITFLLMSVFSLPTTKNLLIEIIEKSVIGTTSYCLSLWGASKLVSIRTEAIQRILRRSLSLATS